MKHEQEYDEMMRQALSPSDEPDSRLNQKILKAAKEREKMAGRNEKNRNRRGMKYQAAAIAAVAVLAAGTVTGVAAWRLLTPDQVAQHSEDAGLAAAFAGKDAVTINESQTYGDYTVSLLGMVSGENISQYVSKDEMGELESDKTYSVVAIERTDGTAMPDTSSEEYGKNPFFVSPLIQGYDPAQYNLTTMGGGYSEFVQDEVAYRLSECDNLEVFADKGVYLCVSSGTFYEPSAYAYDEKSGKITRNDQYQGVNALFPLPLDTAKADSKAAAKYMDSLVAELESGSSTSTETGLADMADAENKAAAAMIEEWMNNLTPENINEYAEQVENTVQKITPDADGYVSAHYELENGAAGDVGADMKELFDGMTEGMSSSFGYSVGDYDMNDLLIETYTLNVDGTVTFAIYVPKQ